MQKRKSRTFILNNVNAKTRNAYISDRADNEMKRSSTLPNIVVTKWSSLVENMVSNTAKTSIITLPSAAAQSLTSPKFHLDLSFQTYLFPSEVTSSVSLGIFNQYNFIPI